MNKVREKPVIAFNKKASYDYFIERRLEAGISLKGWEVKSIIAGKMQLTDSYVIIKNEEAWLLNMHITPLPTVSTHIEPQLDRTRKLLLHRKEISHLVGYIQKEGYTIVALRLYWKKNYIKIELGVAKGKKNYDKREATKKREWDKQKARLFKQH